jgi:hypothetical protein
MTSRILFKLDLHSMVKVCDGSESAWLKTEL